MESRIEKRQREERRNNKGINKKGKEGIKIECRKSMARCDQRRW